MPDYSYWIIAGLLMIIAEFLISGLVVIFLGVAAILVGALVYFGVLDDLTWELTLFAIFSLALLLFVRRYFRDWFVGSETQKDDSGDSAGIVGQRATVEAPFKDGVGTVLYRGARWQAQCSQPLEQGQMVRITRHDGLWLTVEPWSPDA